MTDKQMQSDEARHGFRTLLDDVAHRNMRITVLRYGSPAAVMVPIGWYEAAVKALGEKS